MWQGDACAPRARGPWLWRVCTCVCVIVPECTRTFAQRLCVERMWCLGCACARAALRVHVCVRGARGHRGGAHVCLQQIWGWSAHVGLAVPEPPWRGQAVHTNGASLGLPMCPAAPPLSPPRAGWVLARGMRGRPAGPVLPVVQGGHQGPELAPRRAPAAPESAPPDWRPAAWGAAEVPTRAGARGSGLGARHTPQVGPRRLPSHGAACAFQWGLGGCGREHGNWRASSPWWRGRASLGPAALQPRLALLTERCRVLPYEGLGRCSRERLACLAFRAWRVRPSGPGDSGPEGGARGTTGGGSILRGVGPAGVPHGPRSQGPCGWASRGCDPRGSEGNPGSSCRQKGGRLGLGPKFALTVTVQPQRQGEERRCRMGCARGWVGPRRPHLPGPATSVQA